MVTSTTKNNGIDGYYKKWNIKGKYLIMSGEGNGGFVTYHEGKKWIIDRVRSLLPIRFELNKFIGLFLTTIISKNQYRFSYNNTPNPKDIDELIIMLPSKKNEDGSYSPDWEFMEKYIKSLPYSKYL